MCANTLGETIAWSIDSPSLDVWQHHTGFVYGLDLSPDGTAVASVAWDRTLQVHHTAARLVNRTQNQDVLFGVRFSHDGNQIAYTSPTSLNVLSTDDWSTKAVMPALSYDIGTEAGVRPDFSPDGSFIACGSDAVPCIWTLPDGKLARQLTAHGGTVTDCRFIDDGRRLLSAGGAEIYMHDVHTNSVEKKYVMPGHLMSLAINADETMAAATTANNQLILIDLVNPNADPVTWWQTCPAYDTVFSADGSRLFVGCQDGIIRVWDTTRKQQVATLHAHSAYVHALEMMPDGTLVSGCGDHSVRIWRTPRQPR